MHRLSVSVFALSLCLAGCVGSAEGDGAGTEPGADASDIAGPLEIVRILSNDDMQGRQTGTPGNASARAWLTEQMELRGLAPFGETYEHAFSFENRAGDSVAGINLIARIPGKQTGPVMVVTAHYDHVGVRDGEIYNGADDNASGVAGALSIADAFLATAPEHDVIIALLDGEEMGLQGARAFVEGELVAPGSIGLNLNLDMLSKNDANELYASGSYHTPGLVPLLEAVGTEAPVDLKLGHDRPDQGSDDWTLQSDHGVFHRAGIPFIYFGVEDHKDYHQPSDDYETIPQDFFRRSVETVVMAAERFDTELGAIAGARE